MDFITKRGFKSSKYNHKRKWGGTHDGGIFTNDNTPRYALRALARKKVPHKADKCVTFGLWDDDPTPWIPKCRWCETPMCDCDIAWRVLTPGLSRMKKSLSRPRVRLHRGGVPYKDVFFYNQMYF